MGQVINPAKVVVVPKDGQLEITVNINVSVDGQVSAKAEGADVKSIEKVEEQKPLIPEFLSGVKLNFGKKN